MEDYSREFISNEDSQTGTYMDLHCYCLEHYEYSHNTIGKSTNCGCNLCTPAI